MSSAPGYIEPVVGWRTWLVVQQAGCFRLRSVVYDALWPPRKELFARCLGRSPVLLFPWRRRSEHDPPAPYCGCGIYATREPEDAARYLDVRSSAEAPSVLRVIGTVSLWGQVVECTDGWRAAYAYPKTIHVPTLRDARRAQTEQAQEIALALTDYGVPVDLLDADAHLPADVVAGLGLAAAHS